jgi:hypothetical protein
MVGVKSGNDSLRPPIFLGGMVLLFFLSSSFHEMALPRWVALSISFSALGFLEEI